MRCGLGLDARAVGLTLACYGAGMVVGALLAPRVAAHCASACHRVRPAGVGGGHGHDGGHVALAHGWLAGASFFLFGFGPIVWTITSTTLRQTVTPRDAWPRVGDVPDVNMGARPLAPRWAAWSAPAGARRPAWLALAGFVLQAPVITGSPVRGLVRLPTTAA